MAAAQQTTPDLQTVQMDEWYGAHARELLLFLRNRVGRDSADDLAQEVWLRVSREAAEKFDGRNFRAWLFRIARNVVVDWCRRDHRKYHSLNEGDADPQGETSPMTTIIQVERTDAVRRCVERLTEQQRAVVEARTTLEPTAETAGRLQIAEQSVYSLFHRAVASLRECMKDWTP